jgi:hypothetical protein
LLGLHCIRFPNVGQVFAIFHGEAFLGGQPALVARDASLALSALCMDIVFVFLGMFFRCDKLFETLWVKRELEEL